jgi:hypothetical protein
MTGGFHLSAWKKRKEKRRKLERERGRNRGDDGSYRWGPPVSSE